MERILEIIKGRRSVRRFKPDPIPDGDLAEILEAATWAPSAGNAQPWRFVVVRDRGLKAELVAAALGQGFIAEAPVVVVVCADLERARRAYGERGEGLYCIQDTAAATQNMLLAAHAKGLGNCWVGAFSEEEVRAVLSLPDGLRPVAIVPIGRPAQEPRPRPRRPLEEVVEYR
ncbi:MAG: nitroreductase family protein [Caldiserica bacterium]|nr:nitroreductase family protein [Caldisericota bacterium]